MKALKGPAIVTIGTDLNKNIGAFLFVQGSFVAASLLMIVQTRRKPKQQNNPRIPEVKWR